MNTPLFESSKAFGNILYMLGWDWVEAKTDNLGKIE